jgi:hypothetical protein
MIKRESEPLETDPSSLWRWPCWCTRHDPIWPAILSSSWVIRCTHIYIQSGYLLLYSKTLPSTLPVLAIVTYRSEAFSAKRVTQPFQSWRSERAADGGGGEALNFPRRRVQKEGRRDMKGEGGRCRVRVCVSPSDRKSGKRERHFSIRILPSFGSVVCVYWSVRPSARSIPPPTRCIFIIFLYFTSNQIIRHYICFVFFCLFALHRYWR